MPHQQADRFGQIISTSSDSAAAAYIAGIDLQMTACPGAAGKLAVAIAEDPDFALAHIAMARALQMQGDAESAAQSIARAQALAPSLGEREQSHIRVLSKAVTGDGPRALHGLKAHMREYPRDGFILSLTTGVYGLLGFSGAADHHQQQRDLLEELAPYWGEDWWFIGYRGWAHVETGNAAWGAPLIEKSLATGPVNGNAAHARAHAFYEMGQTGEGMDFLDRWLPAYAQAGSLYPHLSWHLALFALREGEPGKAATLYDERFKPSLGKQPPFFTIVDAGAFNWRCLLRGLRRPEDDIRETADYAARHFSTPGIGFANVHAAYAFAAAGDSAALESHLAGTARLANAAVHPSARVVDSICRGIARFAAEDYDGAIAHLEAAMPELPRIGGSHAQRDGVLETLICACLRAGKTQKAEALLAGRLGLRSIWSKAA